MRMLVSRDVGGEVGSRFGGTACGDLPPFSRSRTHPLIRQRLDLAAARADLDVAVSSPVPAVRRPDANTAPTIKRRKCRKKQG